MSSHWVLHSELAENSAKFCSTLLIGKCSSITESFPRNGLIDEDAGNGTLTFVKYKKKTYGITCWHVIEELRKLNKSFGSEHTYCFYTMTPEPKALLDSFQKVYSDFESRLDIGIIEIPRNRINTLKKKALNLESLEIPKVLEFGIAVGFPEGLKYKIINNIPSHEILSLPHVEIIAERKGVPNGRFTISSNLEAAHDYSSYSGMSGGPVFWSNEKGFGIIGIARSVETHESVGRMTISVACELATPQEIIYWIDQYEKSKQQ